MVYIHKFAFWWYDVSQTVNRGKRRSVYELESRTGHKGPNQPRCDMRKKKDPKRGEP